MPDSPTSRSVCCLCAGEIRDDVDKGPSCVECGAAAPLGQNERSCPRCRGTGRVVADHVQSCAACDGTGRVSEDYAKGYENGKRIGEIVGAASIKRKIEDALRDASDRKTLREVAREVADMLDSKPVGLDEGDLSLLARLRSVLDA